MSKSTYSALPYEGNDTVVEKAWHMLRIFSICRQYINIVFVFRNCNNKQTVSSAADKTVKSRIGNNIDDSLSRRQMDVDETEGKAEIIEQSGMCKEQMNKNLIDSADVEIPLDDIEPILNELNTSCKLSN